jgi:hypothetical protein
MTFGTTLVFTEWLTTSCLIFRNIMINPNHTFHINVGQFIQGYWINLYLNVKIIRICEKYCIKILQLDLQCVFQMTISTSLYILAHLWNHFSHCFLVNGSYVALSMRYVALPHFGCCHFCKIQFWWTGARHALVCSETEGSHFKTYCKSTHKIFRKVLFLSIQVIISS